MTFASIDHVTLAVADVGTATAAYSALLGRAPSWLGHHPTYGTRNALFRLDNTYVELLAGSATTPAPAMLRDAIGNRLERPFALAIGVADIDAAVELVRSRGVQVTDPTDGEGIEDHSERRRTWRNAWLDSATTRGVQLMLVQHTSAPDLLPPATTTADPESVCTGVDHLVMFTPDLEATLRFWAETFGIGERWRRDFPQRGTRNVGLVLDRITIECVTQLSAPPAGARDRFWGVAYRTPNCDRAAERIRAGGIEIDAARPGLAPRTRVATVRWQRTPTLLLAREERTRDRNE